MLRAGSLALAVLISGLLALMVAQSNPTEAEAQSSDNSEFQYAVKMHPEFFFYDDPKLSREDELDKALDMAKAAGINTIDSDVIWKALDQGDWGGQPRTYDWSHLDRMVAEVEERNMTLNFHINSTPDWVHPYLKETTPNPEDRKWYAPRGAQELRHWSNFVRDLSSRYEGRVNHYEIWNEPNHKPFWHSGPKASEYAPFLRTGYLAIKAEDPNAKVVFGGLALSNLGYLNSYYDFVEKKYPDAAKRNYYFDVLGVHPYAQHRSPDVYTQDFVCKPDSTGKSYCDSAYFVGEADNNYLGFKRMKKLMDDREKTTNKDLYFGEMGYSAAPEDPITDSQRAFFLKRAYEIARETPYVQGMAWYAFHDPIQAADHPKWTLLSPDYTPSKSYQAYKEVTGAAKTEVEVQLRSTQSLRSTTVTLQPSAQGLSADEVRNWEIYKDGRLVKNQAGMQPVDWNTQDGSLSSLRAVVYTKDGSVWYSSDKDTVGEPVAVKENPAIESVRPVARNTIKDRTPLISAKIDPGDWNISARNVRMTVDGRALDNIRYDSNGDRAYRTSSRLDYGWHKVRTEVRFDSGKMVTKTWNFRVVR